MSLGVVVIGAGDMGARHAQHWASAGVKVIAIADPDLKRAEDVARAMGAKAFAATPRDDK